jgi:hypothetical protein
VGQAKEPVYLAANSRSVKEVIIVTLHEHTLCV